jgi:hypothetical protein
MMKEILPYPVSQVPPANLFQVGRVRPPAMLSVAKLGYPQRVETKDIRAVVRDSSSALMVE